MASQSTITGSSGEHFVMHRLLSQGYIAALAPDGVPNVDIVVTDVTGNKTAVVQVKTRRNLGSDKGWHMKDKHENIVGDRLFYCFVDLGVEEGHLPVTYVIPSNIVAKTLKRAHEIWLATPGRGGKPHKDTVLRRLLPDYSSLPLSKAEAENMGEGWLEKYKENWGLLNL